MKCFDNSHQNRGTFHKFRTCIFSTWLLWCRNLTPLALNQRYSINIGWRYIDELVLLKELKKCFNLSILKNPVDIILVGKKLPDCIKIADTEVTPSHLELPKLIFWLSFWYYLVLVIRWSCPLMQIFYSANKVTEPWTHSFIKVWWWGDT